MNPIKRKLTIYVTLGALLLLAILFTCIFMGSSSVPPGTVFSTILQHLGMPPGMLADTLGLPTRTQEIILVNIRIPRILLAAVVGGGLAVVGCVMQAVFKNPMAEPGILGWSSGGALAAVIVIYTGTGETDLLLLPAAAFAGTLLSAVIIYKIASVKGYTSSAMLLLTGVALNSLFVALTTLVLSVANVWTMKEMLFWLMGGVDARGWPHLQLAAPVVLISSSIVMLYARDLNAILLGEETAGTLGVNVRAVKSVLLLLCSLIVGACVAVSGVIGFVGLIIPHLLRLLVGADHKVLLPMSFLAGAAFLPLADLITRTAAKPVELRLGIITACLGVPFFLFLLRKHRSRVAGGL